MTQVDVVAAETPAQLDAVRALIREFVAWHRRMHPQYRKLIDRYFDEAAFEAELAGLPGKYAPPKGALRLASVDGVAAGVVALRDLGEERCEMKRMFVPERHRGLGIGRALADDIIAAGRSAGYRSMRLDTSRSQTDAMRLYERSGFREIPPYYEVADDELRAWLIFYEKDL
jgi:ribosomal protein S18 acetylase RimI-like enzyme